MKCSICNGLVNEERAALGLTLCFTCAMTHVQKYKGDMNYQHKTAPSLMIMSATEHKNYRRYVPYGKYTGRGSGTHKMTTQLTSLK